jgi:hypothetical protein
MSEENIWSDTWRNLRTEKRGEGRKVLETLRHVKRSNICAIGVPEEQDDE